MKLTSMVNFVLQKDITDIKQRDSIVKYANFLRQPLKLEMFINCDDDGNFFEEPKNTNYQVDVNTKCSGWKYLYDNNDKLIGYYDDRKWKEDFVKYKQSKEKVLFEIEKSNYKFTIEDAKYLIGYYSTVEQFINAVISNEIMVNFNLTSNAIKQIGL